MSHYLYFLFPMCHMTLSSPALGSYLTICENVARAAALCDLEAPGWGSLGFRIVLLLIPGSQISVWHSCGLSVFVVCFTSAIPIPWWYKAIIFLVHCKDYELISWPPAVLSCFLLFCLLFVLVRFVLFLFSLSAFLFLHGDSTMDYVSIQSVLFWCTRSTGLKLLQI